MECLESLLVQTETRWECLLVDDGSNDRSVEIGSHFAVKDSRIRVVPCEHSGIVGSLNTGLELCRGPFVARMDADDRMHPERLALQRGALEANPGWAAVGCQVELFPADAVTDGRREYARWLNGISRPEEVRNEAFVECPIAHPALFARRKPMQDFGYRAAGWPEDYDMVLRWLGAGLRLANVSRPLLEWRETPGRLSRTSEVYGIDRFTACKASHLFESFLRRSPGYTLWGHGSTGRALRKELERLGSRPTRIVEVHPRRLGESIHGAEVIPPEALPVPASERIVVSVAGAKRRARIRRWLSRHGHREGVDYVCAA